MGGPRKSIKRAKKFGSTSSGRRETAAHSDGDSDDPSSYKESTNRINWISAKPKLLWETVRIIGNVFKILFRDRAFSNRLFC